MRRESKVGIVTAVACVCLMALAIILLSVLPGVESSFVRVGTIFGAIMSTGFAVVSAIVAVAAFLDR